MDQTFTLEDTYSSTFIQDNIAFIIKKPGNSCLKFTEGDNIKEET
jgi:hypothetical protein